MKADAVSIFFMFLMVRWTVPPAMDMPKRCRRLIPIPKRGQIDPLFWGYVNDAVVRTEAVQTFLRVIRVSSPLPID